MDVQGRAESNLVTFRLGQEIYALPVAPIVQIISMVTITPLPEIGDPVAGVINVRGQVVPVVDLRSHIGQVQAPLLLYTPIVLTRIHEGTVGLIVDEVLDVLQLPPGELIEPETVLPPELGQAPVLAALAPISGRLTLLLDPEHLFGPQQREALARAAEALPELLQDGARAEADTPAGIEAGEEKAP
jgi:purine-binding chemotaxis protein CheW